MGRWLLVAALLALASLAHAQIGGPGPGQCKGFRLLKDGTLAGCVDMVDSTSADFTWTCGGQKCGLALNTNVSHFGSCLDATKICASGGTYTGSLTFGSGGSLTFASGSTLALATGTATLNGETLLPPTSFVLRAGRTGSTNDFTLSTDLNGSITGSATTGKSLSLYGNSAGTGTSVIYAYGRLRLPMASAVTVPGIDFGSADGTPFVTGLLAPSVGGNVNFTLPSGYPTVNAQHLTATTAGVMSWKADNPVLADAYCACNGTTDDTAAFASALTAAGGGAVYLRPGCKILGATPGAGAATWTVPLNTRIICADHTAGFVAAAKKCTAGSFGTTSAVGAGCATNTGATDGCGTGGICAFDGALSSVFAPSAGQSYTMLKAAAGAGTVDVIGCTFFEQGVDGSNGTAFNTCATGTNQGRSCKVDADCASAVCNGAPRTPSGPGKLNALDLSPLTGTQAPVIDNVQVIDHRLADFDISTGTTPENTDVTRFTNLFRSFTDDATSPLGTTTIGAAVLLNGGQDRVSDSTIHAGSAGAGIAIKVNATTAVVVNNSLTALGNASSAGIAYAGGQYQNNNIVFTGTGMLPNGCATDPLIENNFLFGPIIAGVAGLQVCGSGVRVLGNYIAVGLGPAVVLGGVGSVSHAAVIGNTLAGTASVSVKYLTAGAQTCSRGWRRGLTCTLDTTDTTNGCPSGNTGCSSTPGLNTNGESVACCTGSGTGSCGASTCPSGIGTQTCCDGLLFSDDLVEANSFPNGAAGEVDMSALNDNTSEAVRETIVGNLVGFSGTLFRGPTAGNTHVANLILAANRAANIVVAGTWSGTYGDPGITTATETELDFGATPTFAKTFTITDAFVASTSKLILAQSGNAATSRQADENEFDHLMLTAVPGAGSFTLYAASPQPVSGKYKVLYEIH